MADGYGLWLWLMTSTLAISHQPSAIDTERSVPRREEALAFAWRRLEIEHPDASAGGVVAAAIALDHRTPGFERAHLKGVALEVAAHVVEHFLRVPVVGEQRVTGMHAQHREVAIVRRLRPHVARRPALLPLGNDVTFLRDRRLLIRVAHDSSAATDVGPPFQGGRAGGLKARPYEWR